jgi:hypothetical protein
MGDRGIGMVARHPPDRQAGAVAGVDHLDLRQGWTKGVGIPRADAVTGRLAVGVGQFVSAAVTGEVVASLPALIGRGAIQPGVNCRAAGQERDGWSIAAIVAQRAKQDAGRWGEAAVARAVVGQVVGAAAGKAIAAAVAARWAGGDDRVVERGSALVIDSAGVDGAIAGEGAVVYGQRAIVGNAAALYGCGVAIEGAVGDDQRAAAIANRSAAVAGVVRESAVGYQKCDLVPDAAAAPPPRRR